MKILASLLFALLPVSALAIDSYGIYEDKTKTMPKESQCSAARENALNDASMQANMLIESKGNTTISNGVASSQKEFNQQSLSKLHVVSERRNFTQYGCEVYLTVDESEHEPMSLADYDANNKKIQEVITGNGGYSFDFKTSSVPSINDVTTLNNAKNVTLKSQFKPLKDRTDFTASNERMNQIIKLIRQNMILQVVDVKTTQYNSAQVVSYTIKWSLKPSDMISILKIVSESNFSDLSDIATNNPNFPNQNFILISNKRKSNNSIAHFYTPNILSEYTETGDSVEFNLLQGGVDETIGMFYILFLSGEAFVSGIKENN